MPHDRLIDELHALCVAGRSGTMFIITGENHAAQFVLRNGEIVYLTYRLLRGLDALPSMRIFTAGRYRFQDEPVDRADPGLPPTPDLLALLSPEHTGTVEPPPTEPTTGTAKAPDSLRLLIERELAEFLGPMASLICEEHLAQATDLDSPKSLARLVESTPTRLGTPQKRPTSSSRFSPISVATLDGPRSAAELARIEDCGPPNTARARTKTPVLLR
jgi:hypothetical protein